MANPALDNNADAILADYMRRSDAGETIDREAFIAAHPQVADELREYFASVDDVERMAGPPLASTVKNGIKAAETHVSSVGDSVSEKPARQTQSADVSTADTLPESFGRYRIEKRLGRGAMGAVYLAHDTQLDRLVALKTPTFDTDADADMVERFYREARAAANLRHAGICPIFDVGTIDGTHYISMAYIEGKPMSALVDVDKPLPIRSVVSLVRKIALALDHAHSQGVIHRDLKPANIMIDKQKQPLIMDFGLARQVDKHEQTRLTQNGMILGTPAYMSPEQVQGDLESGKQSDVYSLGVILYELLTGDLPFQGTVAAVIGQIMTQDAPAPSKERAEIDPALDAICQQMMARKLEDRSAGTKEAADALTDYLKGKSNRNPASLRSRVSPSQATQTVTADEGLAAFLETASKDEFPAVKTRRDGTLTQLVAPWKKLPPRTKVIATSGLAGLLLVMMGVVIMLRTPSGTVRVEVNDPNIVVKIDNEILTLKEGVGHKDKTVDKHQLSVLVGETPVPLGEEATVTLDGARQKVRLTVSGVELTAGEFVVKRNETVSARIQLERIKAPPTNVTAPVAVAGPLTPDDRPIPDGPPGEVLVLRPGPLKISSAYMSPDGQWILTSLEHGNEVRTQSYLWSTRMGRIVAKLPGTYRGGWLPDSTSFVTYIGADVQIRSVRQPLVATKWSANQHDVMSPPAFTPDGERVLIGGWDRTLTLSNVRTRTLLKTLRLKPEKIRVDSVAISADGRTGYSYSPFANTRICVWDLESGEVRKTNPVSVTVCGARGRFSRFGRRFLGYGGARIALIDSETGQDIQSWEGPERQNHAVALSPQGRYALTIGDDHIIRVWNAEKAKLLHEFRGHTDYVRTLQFSNDLRFAVSAGHDGTARVWRLPKLEPEGQPTQLDPPKLVSQFEHEATRTRQCYLAFLSPDAARVTYRLEWGKPLQMFETASRKVVALPDVMQTAVTLDVNADGTLLATGHNDGTVRLWNSQTLEPVGQPFVTTAGFWASWVSLSDDGKSLLVRTTEQPPKFYAWDVKSRKPITEPFALNVDKKAKGIHITSSADNLLLAVAYYEKEEGSKHLVQLWDVKTGRPRATQFDSNQGSLGTIFNIDLSPRGDRLAVASKNGNCFVFDTETGQLTMTAAHGARVAAARFSPNGRQLATCGGPADSEDMHLWDVATGEELVRWHLPRNGDSVRTKRDGAWASHLVYSRDGSRLLTAGVNTPVCVWKLKSTSQAVPKPIAPPTPPTVTENWTDLFNGKDLTGWAQMKTSGSQDDVHRPTTGDWVVQDGQILCNTISSGWLKSARQFDNFELELEFKLSQLGNSGVYIRSSGSGRLSRTGMEAQVIDDTAAKYKLTSKNRSGAIHGVIGPSTSALKPIGEWNRMSIRCAGELIHVTLNGVVTAEQKMSEESLLRDRPRSGYLGLANWHGQGKGTAFRNIRIRGLDKTVNVSVPGSR